MIYAIYQPKVSTYVYVHVCRSTYRACTVVHLYVHGLCLLQEDFEDFEAIDVDGDDFKAMPEEIQHEILTELKARQKQNSWAKIETLPEVGSV